MTPPALTIKENNVRGEYKEREIEGTTMMVASGGANPRCDACQEIIPDGEEYLADIPAGFTLNSVEYVLDICKICITSAYNALKENDDE